MSRPSSLTRLLSAAAAVCALALIAAPSIAVGQDKPLYDEAHYDDQIVVTAPGPYREYSGRRTESGARIETIVSERVVYTDDLDLRRDRDVSVLHSRIRASANDACGEVLQLSTGAGAELTTRGACIRGTVRDAMEHADALVYYARY